MANLPLDREVALFLRVAVFLGAAILLSGARGAAILLGGAIPEGRVSLLTTFLAGLGAAAGSSSLLS